MGPTRITLVTRYPHLHLNIKRVSPVHLALKHPHWRPQSEIERFCFPQRGVQRIDRCICAAMQSVIHWFKETVLLGCQCIFGPSHGTLDLTQSHDDDDGEQRRNSRSNPPFFRRVGFWLKFYELFTLWNRTEPEGPETTLIAQITASLDAVPMQG